jgi:hypothetical protein
MASSNSSPRREILRMRVYRIPSRDFLLICGQYMLVPKAKAVTLHATQALGERGGIAPIIDLGTRWG